MGGMTVHASTARPSIPPTRFAYKGMMYSDVPNLARRLGLHQRLVDAEGRPGLRIRLPAAQSHAQGRPAPVHAAARRSRRWSACRGSTSRRATSSAPSTSSPSRARAKPWRLNQNYALDLMQACATARWRIAQWCSQSREFTHFAPIRPLSAVALAGVTWER